MEKRQTSYDEHRWVNVHVCFRLPTAQKIPQAAISPLQCHELLSPHLLRRMGILSLPAVSPFLTNVAAAAPTVRRQSVRLRRSLEGVVQGSRFQVLLSYTKTPTHASLVYSVLCSWGPRPYALVINFSSLFFVSITLIAVAWREVRNLCVYCSDFSRFLCLLERDPFLPCCCEQDCLIVDLDAVSTLPENQVQAVLMWNTCAIHAF